MTILHVTLQQLSMKTGSGLFPANLLLMHIHTDIIRCPLSRFAISCSNVYPIPMAKPAFEQFGITKEQFESIYAKKKNIRNYTFGISSAAGILAGCIFGIYLAQGAYETVLFILFFGCFLGSLFGGIFTMMIVGLYVILMYIFSPAYRNCRKYLSAKSRAGSQD